MKAQVPLITDKLMGMLNLIAFVPVIDTAIVRKLLRQRR